MVELPTCVDCGQHITDHDYVYEHESSCLHANSGTFNYCHCNLPYRLDCSPYLRSERGETDDDEEGEIPGGFDFADDVNYMSDY